MRRNTSERDKRLIAFKIICQSFYFTLSSGWQVIKNNNRAQNCKQNVFTQWHTLIYLLNNYLVGRNKLVQSLSFHVGTSPSGRGTFVSMSSKCNVKKIIALYLLMEKAVSSCLLKRGYHFTGKCAEKAPLPFGLF